MKGTSNAAPPIWLLYSPSIPHSNSLDTLKTPRFAAEFRGIPVTPREDDLYISTTGLLLSLTRNSTRLDFHESHHLENDILHHCG